MREVANPNRDSDSQERIEVIRDFAKATDTLIGFIHNAKSSMDAFSDSAWPSVATTFQPYFEALINASKRGVRIRVVTEITKENIQYCKEAMKFAELRHIDGIRGNFGVTETEYAASAVLQEEKPITQLVYSNAREVVEQQRYVFKSFWNKGTPAGQRIKEIEEGLVRTETRLIEDPHEIKELFKKQLSSDENQWSICSPIEGLVVAHENLLSEHEKFLADSRAGRRKGERWLTSFGKEHIPIVRQFLAMGMQIKSSRHLPLISFSVSDKTFNVTVDKMESGRMMRYILVSNDQIYIDHYNTIFQDLWENGVDAEDRIREIEQGIEQGSLEIIPNAAKAADMGVKLINSARHEVLLMLSASCLFLGISNSKVIDILKKLAYRGVKIKLTIPSNESLASDIEKPIESLLPNIEIRVVEETIQDRMPILVVDEREAMFFEIKDTSATAGVASYSNSNSVVASYVAIFESIWKQAELYEQVKMHDRMQKEFINIAAHELRTPIQPILGMAEILQTEMNRSQDGKIEISKDDLALLVRSAKRLEHLSSDILQATRIESGTLRLHKELFDLNEKVRNVVRDITVAQKTPAFGEIINHAHGVQIVIVQRHERIMVYADKPKMFEVISNLLTNALKFTEHGSITITADKNTDINSGKEFALVTVQDTGIGIDPEIMPRLFSRFATKSEKGTGLGLFISKSIVEAHGGTMWAENNKDGQGATFSFTLPIDLPEKEKG